LSPSKNLKLEKLFKTFEPKLKMFTRQEINVFLLMSERVIVRSINLYQ